MMSYARFAQMLQRLPTNARKLYELIPIGEAWTYLQIHQEALRSGLNMPHTTVMGCVGELKDSGLVYEPTQHTFQRCPHKPRPEPRATNNEQTEHTTTMANGSIAPIKTRPAGAAPEEPQTPVDKLGSLAAQLRQLSAGLTNAADDLDLLAMEIEDRAAKDSGAAAELARIRDTFKALGLGAAG